MSPRRIVSRPGVMWGGIGGPPGGLRAQPDKWVGSCASVEGRPQTGSEDDTSEERTKRTAHRDLLRWRNSMSGPSIHPSDWSDKTMLMFGISLLRCIASGRVWLISIPIIAAKNSVLTFLSFVPWLLYVTLFVFFFVIVFVFCVFVFDFEFCFFDPWLRCVTPPSARIGPSPISENTSIRLPHQTGNIRMNKTLCTKKIVSSELIAVYHSILPKTKQTKCDKCKIWLKAIKHMNVYGAWWLCCPKCPEVNRSFQKYSSHHLQIHPHTYTVHTQSEIIWGKENAMLGRRRLESVCQ